MKTTNKINIITLATLILSSSPATAQNGVFSLETDPATFALDGYAIHIRYSADKSSHWIYGIGAYALDIPNAMVDVNSKNRDQGWDVRIDSGIGLFSEYYFNASKQGWFVGGQLSTQKFEISNTATGPEKAKFTNALLMLHTGYRYYPGKAKQFYTQPWLGVGYTDTISGDTRLGSKTYDVSPVTGFVTLHIGYDF